MPGWSKRPLFKNPTMMVNGGYVGMPKGMSIPGYQDGNVVVDRKTSDETILEGVKSLSRFPIKSEFIEMPAYRQEQLAKEAEYQNAIEKTARLFSTSNSKASDYMSNIHYFAGNLSNGHQIPKEQVMQDLMKAIEAQRSAPKMKTGGIVGLENGGMMPGGMMPELFEGEEIVETNPTINAMAAQDGSLSAKTLPETDVRGVPSAPNERGIVSMAVEAEELAEEDNPIVTAAKQEAKERLRLEFDIVKSTAAADAAQGRDPSFIIKESMDNLARSAKSIEQETVEKYPEIPLNTDLLNSQDLEPYQQELVSVFEMPAQNEEISLEKDSIVMAKNGGKIPGYQEGGVANVPEEWAWIDEDIRAKGMSLEESEREMIQRYGSDITAMRKILRKDRELSPREKEEIKRGMSLEQLANMDTREADLIKAMKETGFETASQPSIFQRKRNRTIDIIKNPEVRKLIDQYRAMGEPEETVVETENGAQSEQEAIAAYAKAIEDGTETPAWAKKVLSDSLREAPEKEVKTTTDPVEVSPSPSPSPRSSSVADLLKRIEDLGATMDTGIDTAKTDVKKRAGDLTGVYDEEVKKSTDAVNAANTSINNALTSYEKRIPDLALLRAQSSGKPTFAQRRTLAKLYDTQLRAGVDNTRIELGKLEKELQEARRENNLAASRDIKARQLDAISRLNELAIEQGFDLELKQLETMLTHEMRLDEIRMQAELAQTNTGVNQQLISAMNDLKARITNETDPDAKALLESELDTYRTVVLGQKSPQAQITTALLEGNYKELFSAYSVEDMQRYAPSLQGEKTIQIEGIPQPLTGSFPDFYNYMVSKKKPNKEVYYTDKEIVEMWKRGKG